MLMQILGFMVRGEGYSRMQLPDELDFAQVESVLLIREGWDWRQPQ